MQQHLTRLSALVLAAAFGAMCLGGCTSGALQGKTVTDTSVAQQVGNSGSSDYLPKGTVLAAFYGEDSGYSETRYYPAKIVTKASAQTKGEYQVRTLIGDFDVGKGDKNWTKNVILQSHPAQKDEIKKGMKVLYTNKPADEGLAGASWHRGIVGSTEKLYKNKVQIEHVWHLDKSDEADRQKTIPVKQIRIIDKAVK